LLSPKFKMKCIVFVAIVALVSAVEEKKPVQQDEKKPEQHGLQWPLPDPMSEGDLMLHGAISFDRVQALHKGKVEDEADKMILAHGRQFLRKVAKFFDDNADFNIQLYSRIIPVLCRDSRNLNGTNNRWRIEIPKAQPAQQGEKEQSNVQRDQPLPKDNSTNENETTTVQPSTERPSSEHPSSERPSSERPSSERPSSERPSSERPSSEKPTDKPATTIKPLIEPAQKDTYEVQRHEFYGQVGANFARLLMKEYRKEQLNAEETEYLARWIADEAVHYGAWAIYCHEGENVKEIKKQLVTFLEEKP